MVPLLLALLKNTNYGHKVNLVGGGSSRDQLEGLIPGLIPRRAWITALKFLEGRLAPPTQGVLGTGRTFLCSVGPSSGALR